MFIKHYKQLWKITRDKGVNFRKGGLHKLSHKSLRVPDILHNVIVSGYVTFYQIKIFL